MDKIFLTSDLHVGHRNVIKYCKRPYASVDEMNEDLIRKWNEVVSPVDTVYVLGDVFFCPFSRARQYTSLLHGKKILLRGNHDKFQDGQYLRAGFDEVVNGWRRAKMTRDDLVICRFDPTWDETCRRLAMLRHNDYYDVVMSHYPYKPGFWWRLRSKLFGGPDLRYLDRRPPNEGLWLLHGHSHGQNEVKGRMFDVGVDCNNYKPVLLSTIFDHIKAKEGS